MSPTTITRWRCRASFSSMCLRALASRYFRSPGVSLVVMLIQQVRKQPVTDPTILLITVSPLMHMQSLTGVRSVHCEVADRRPVTALAALIALIALVVLIETRQSDYSSSTTAVVSWQRHSTCLVALHAITLIVPPLCC